MLVLWWFAVFIIAIGVLINFVQTIKIVKQDGLALCIGPIINIIGGGLILLSLVGLGMFIDKPISKVVNTLLYGIGLVGAIYAIVSAYALLRISVESSKQSDGGKMLPRVMDKVPSKEEADKFSE